MKKTIKNKGILDFLQKIFPFMALLCSVLISVAVTWYFTGHILDSDASSEMVLAKQLSENNEILSKDWLYSTELRILNSHLFFAFFFRIWNDWHLVRFSSAILLQAIMAVSYSFMLRKAGFEKRDVCLATAMLLLPASVTYGRIILYHSHYIVHLCLAFFVVGVVIGFAEELNLKKPKTCLALTLMAVLSFIGGLAGIRHLMVVHAPLLLSIAVLSFVEDYKSTNPQKAALLSPEKLRLLIPACLGAAASFAGIIINDKLFSKQYYLDSKYTVTTLDLLNFSELPNIFYGFFHQFGFRKSLSLLSVMGILSVLALVAGCYCLVICTKKFLKHENQNTIGQDILCVFLLCFSAIMMALFFLTGSHRVYYYVLYLSLCYPWAIIPLFAAKKPSDKKAHPFHVKRIFYWLTLLCFLLNSIANIGFFLGIRKFRQPYEGLYFQNLNCVSEKEDAVAFLCENGYTLGYATHWNGNVMTEMSDGNIQMVNIKMDQNNGNITYYDWLSFLSVRELPAQNQFILISKDEFTLFETSDLKEFCTLIYEDPYQRIYRIENLDKTLLYG